MQYDRHAKKEILQYKMILKGITEIWPTYKIKIKMINGEAVNLEQ